MYARLRCRQAPERELLDEWIGQQRLQLRKQHVIVGRRELCIIEPADVDAVMDMYIAAGTEAGLDWVQAIISASGCFNFVAQSHSIATSLLSVASRPSGSGEHAAMQVRRIGIHTGPVHGRQRWRWGAICWIIRTARRAEACARWVRVWALLPLQLCLQVGHASLPSSNRSSPCPREWLCT